MMPTTKWVVDALLANGASSWVFNIADEDFETEADAMRWIEAYRPYLSANRIETRAVERIAA